MLNQVDKMFFLMRITTFLLIGFLFEGSKCLRMRNFEVPLHVTRGDTAILKCEFDLEGEKLYSIKWYKGGREFFRYVPNEIPKKQRYAVTGVNVDLAASTGRRVVLQRVSLATSGRYKCEVLGEAPSFDTLTEHAILTVVDIPDEEPIVFGANEKYKPGDIVHVNCTSARSKPAATLKWFINGKPAPRRYLIPYNVVMYPDKLEESTLGLHFQADYSHFPRGSMSLRCTASIGVYFDQEEDYSSQHIPALSLKSREHTFGKAEGLSSLTYTPWIVAFVVCLS